MLGIILVQAVRWTHPHAAEMIIGHGRVFSGYTHISRLRLQKSFRSVSVFVSLVRPCWECRGSRTPSSDPPDLHRQKSRSRADISPLSSVPHSHAHTHPRADTTLLCVCFQSLAAGVWIQGGPLCWTPPPAPSPLLLDTFVVKGLAAQPDSPTLQQP